MNHHPPNPSSRSSSSSSGLTRPRYVKVRKQSSKYKSAPASFDDSGFFNPFRSVLVDSNDNNTNNSNTISNSIADELKNLRLGNFRNDDDGDDDQFFKLQQDISNLNIHHNPPNVVNASGFPYAGLSSLSEELKNKLNVVQEGSRTDDFVFKASTGTTSSSRSSISISSNVNTGFAFRTTTGYKLSEKDEVSLLSDLGNKLSIGNDNLGGFSKATKQKNNHNDSPGVFTFQSGIGLNDPTTSSKLHSDQLGTDPETMGTENIKFQTPNIKGNLFSESNQKVEFAAQRNSIRDAKAKKKKGNSKQPVPIKLWSAQDFIFSGKCDARDNAETVQVQASEEYSPMDISPYQEEFPDARFSRETSVASERSFLFGNDNENTDSPPTGRNDSIDEDLAYATARMEINDEDVNSSKTKDEDCFSPFESESFKSANEDMSGENENSASSNLSRQSSDGMTQFGSPSNSEDMSGSDFIFGASTAHQAPVVTAKRQRKKNVATQNVKIPSSVQFSPLSTTVSSLLTTEQGKKADLPLPQRKCGDNSEVLKEIQVKKELDSNSVAAQEACEKWRLRGNQAYTNGDLSKAEGYYTQGLNCISKSEASRNCLRALMLCYSNRAATRMSLGRMRDALEDCMKASAIDPNFVKAQVRAANCYLALGEVEDATLYFKKCLQSGDDVCVDRKIVIEASDGLLKAQKLSECIQHSSELMRSKTPDDLKSALDVITEALLICFYAETLLEMKAEALLLLGKCEETIQLCEQTFDSAEKNAPLLVSGNQLPNQYDSEPVKEQFFRLWRCRMIVKSYFCLGKLDEAITFLDKQEALWSVANRNESMTLESLIPLGAIVRLLLQYKIGDSELQNAGNAAFQAGKHAEAVDNYTCALQCNVESRPFAAICFCNRAAAYKALGQITDAIADCSLAIALDGNYSKAISRRATLYEMIRDYGKAASDIEKLIDLLANQTEDKTSQTGAYDRSAKHVNDLRQARLRLSVIEGEERKQIPLDVYLILGVEPSVSASEIKKAYRKAALRHHPDKAGQLLVRSENGDDGLWKEIGEEVYKDADRLFKMIGEAYAVLSDPTKRSRYDFEEEMRVAQKKRPGTGSSRTHTDVQHNPYERSGVRRYW
ncbi:hypothetical protein ACFE04_006809 [Oxalis oulophora]